MFCTKCGSKNDDSARFCVSCGGKLGEASGAKEQPTGSSTSDGVIAGDGFTIATVHKTGRVLVIIGVVVILVLVIAAFVTGGFGILGPMVKESVNDYSWEELSKISAEISEASDETSAVELAKKYNLTSSEGKLDGKQIKDLKLADGSNAQVQITGFWHDEKTDGGKAGITLIFKDAIASREMNSADTNSGGWESSQMRSWLAAEGINMLPEDLRSCLVEVEKRTNNSGESDSTSSVTTTSDKLWLYSLVELGGSISASDFYQDKEFLASIYNSEGSQYKMFVDMRVDMRKSNAVLAKAFNGGSCGWWERTPNAAYTNYFYGVHADGEPSMSYFFPDHVEGVVPGFCI